MYIHLQSDLSNGSKLAKDVIHLLCGDLKGEVPVEASHQVYIKPVNNKVMLEPTLRIIFYSLLGANGPAVNEQ